MDIRTGKTYETFEAALADGVPESDIAKITVTRDGNYWPKFANPKHAPHTGKREMARRARQMAKG